ncbi:MAG: molybdopterin converting factor subunit 1 [Rhodobacterales bacterium]|nr:molybdopterin converting factor subunit 1 [Rhodobacterales bacterium]
MRILYFAWLREKVGTAEEAVAPPAEVATVNDLLGWLAERGGGFAEALADRSLVRVAVNQTYVDGDHPVATNDEVALFPPVTGG